MEIRAPPGYFPSVSTSPGLVMPRPEEPMGLQLHEYYKVENLPARETPSTLKKLFAVLPEFQKNRTEQNKHCVPEVEGQAPRRRATRALPRKPDAWSNYQVIQNFLLSLAAELDSLNPQLCPVLGSPARPSLQDHMKGMLVSIDHLVMGLYDRDRSTRFSPHDPRSMTFWQLVYDKCLGLAGISHGYVASEKLCFLWRRCLGELDAAALQVRSAAFLIYLWGICGVLLGTRFFVRFKSDPSALLRIFLQELRGRCLTLMGRQDVLMVLLDSILGLLEAGPLFVKKGLRVGCWKTLDVLAQMVGCSSPLVLKTTAFFCEYYWKADSQLQQVRLERYEPLLDAIHQQSPTHDDIQVLHDFTVSQRHTSPTEIPQYIEVLHRLALQQCQMALGSGPLRYDTASRALQYSVELLARWEEHNQNSKTRTIIARIDEIQVRPPMPRHGNDMVGAHTEDAAVDPGSTSKKKKANAQRRMTLSIILGDDGSSSAQSSTKIVDGPRAPRPPPKTTRPKGPAQTPPMNPNKSCEECGETFRSRKVLFQSHLTPVTQKCPAMYPWAD
ncbi:hypothetical protein QBC47DRAFT_465628 [Echria macrotheca]|uniref:Uncharacterized protein n=1 Tax=Echria macrotheca TaxID=438768 RepID=A0AAJ0B2T0_9PEZI|nr:hypothetical protein QBC47DRAFT_465628 [Echria macrotheca]